MTETPLSMEPGAPMLDEIPHRGLFGRLALWIVAAALAPLAALSVLYYFHLEKTAGQRAAGHIEELAAERADAVSLFLSERMNLLAVLASVSPIEDLSSPDRLKDFLAVLNHGEKSFVDLGLIDESGNHAAYCGPYAIARSNYKDAPWFALAMFRGSLVSDALLGVRKVPHFILAVRRDEGKRSFLLRATMDPAAFERLLAPVRTDETGDAFLVNAAGVFQTPPRFGGAVLESSGISPGKIPPGVTTARRYTRDGRKVLDAYAKLPACGWLLVLERDPAEGGAPAEASLLLVALALCFCATALSVAVLVLVYRAARRIGEEERSRAEAENRASHGARMAALGRMAAGIAHEINNPLAAIGNTAGLLEDLVDETFTEDTQNAREFREHAKKIASLVARAGEITRKMLGFARRMEPALDDLSVNELLRETVSYLEKDALYRNIEIEFKLDETLPKIRSDRSQLQQVFLTLVNNAMDAVDTGGHIWIETRFAGSFVDVMVGDDGPGMDKYTLQHAFDPFFTTKAPGQGTGLGLSVAFSIVEGLGGRLLAASLPGEGARFTVRLPLSAGA